MQQESSRSPWSQVTHYRLAEIKPVVEPISARLRVPGSKSFTNRALTIAALAKGQSRLSGILKSDDSYWCIDALRRLGVTVSVDGDQVRVQGVEGEWPQKKARLFIGAAGTIARFLPGALAAGKGGHYEVDGVEQLRKRPLRPLIDALRHLGANIETYGEAGGLPLKVEGTGLKGGKVRIEGHVSSQFLSGLLLASPLAAGPVHIEVEKGLVQPAYVGITVQLMRQFGAVVEHDHDFRSFVVQPGGYTGRETVLEADASTACYFLAAAALTQGTVRITNVGYQSLQPDAKFIDVLERMGCQCEKTETYLQVKGPARLKGGFTVDMKPMSDQAITIAALAPFADAPVTVTNVAHIRHHESDRIDVICTALRKIGIKVEEREDGFTVYPGQPTGATLDPHDDHRQAMTFTLLGLKVPGIIIENPGCVSKTCPMFYSEMKKIGVPIKFIA
ncbi:3-phosphoshikimate 1-carboxyvinyltransferase [Caldalkalibacillus thermarum TA2.A1]|uniref:3-phosphoshikimate 1-carboxyvinyltransferase n=1 Tax=Caldalkalibacillus thermarum (strain TA2.A1) TaxID=986075 RepID=F5L736_CALTT|nr:3-phosphoshikimate 1-carboxyvinyltransferase [Caldalkalibacillus thermarum]EGL82871.1 3-phosphoshikimate 1-carboxyvinyltransferase [Caldalkalibacillus thermarum TA2.A1]